MRGDRDWSSLVLNTTKEIALSAIALPAELKKFITRALRGELEVRQPSLQSVFLHLTGRELRE